MKKLSLNKEVIVNISNNQMWKIVGGTGTPEPDKTIQQTDAICNNAPKPQPKPQPIERKLE